MSGVRLVDSARVTLDGSGTGTVRFGPTRPGERWHVTSVSVSVSTNTSTPVAKVYRGNVGPGTFISGTYDGALDTDPQLNEQLWPGEYLSVQWTGGDSGATATATYRGTIETRM